jgi:hypothetical protein
MTFDKHELKVLAAAGHLAAAPGEPVHKSALSFLFARPGFLQKQIDKLRLHGFITFDPFKSEVRVLAKPVLAVLNEFAQSGELFQNERPLDPVLAESLRADLTVGVLKNTNVCENTQDENGGRTARCLAPVPPKPPDPPPDSIENPSRKPKSPSPKTEIAVTENRTNPGILVSASRGLTGSSVMSDGKKNFKTEPTDAPIKSDERFGTATRHPSQIDRQCSESELMRELELLLGRDEMSRSGGHWRVDHVRRHPTVVFNLLIQLKELIAAGWVFKTNRAAWLESSIRNELSRRKVEATR